MTIYIWDKGYPQLMNFAWFFLAYFVQNQLETSTSFQAIKCFIYFNTAKIPLTSFQLTDILQSPPNKPNSIRPMENSRKE